MPLPAGARLGRYEIRATLGAGGMGEVYRAHDVSLRRDVAIKVLPDEFAIQVDRVRRFQLEALATAALNHPHIVAVYDAGTHEQRAYVVTELLEGRTLREVLSGGPVPLRKAIEYATQIASGLAAAHEKDIVHRDLKPENLFVTRDERVKILDFGLARVLDRSPLNAEGATGTTAGMILGTVGYMSPEQVRGEPADHRADIFAFGVIVYELLTGRRAFQRDTATGTLAAILHDDPPVWTGDGTVLSLRLMRLVQRCLEKSPAARFQSARDLMLVLSDEVTDTSLAPATRPRRRTALLVSAGIIVLIAVGIGIGLSLRPAPPIAQGTVAPTTFRLSLPAGEAWVATMPQAISNDGRLIAAGLVRAGVRRLHVLSLDTGEWRPLPGTENARTPFFSFDGRDVGFVKVDGKVDKLMRTPVDGGQPVEICAVSAVRGATWGDDGQVVFGVLGGGLMRVAASGGTPVPMTSKGPAEDNHRFPFVLPGSRTVLFTVMGPDQKGSVAASVIGSRVHTIVAPDGFNPRYVDGYLIYVTNDGVVLARSFDPVGLTVTGEPVAVRARPGGGEYLGDNALRVSAVGTAVYQPFVQRQSRLVLADRHGKVTPLPAPVQAYGEPRVSPDGKRLIVSISSGLQSVDLFVYDIAGDSLTRVTEGGNSRFPQWVDNQRIVYTRREFPGENIYRLEIDPGGRPVGAPKRLVVSSSSAPGSVVGSTLIYGQADANLEWDIWTLELDKPEDRRPMLVRPGNQYGSRVSPDRKWLAYASDETTGQFEIYVTTYPTPGAIMKVSDGGGQGPLWSRTGDELFFMQGTQMVARRFTAAGPVPGAAVPTGVTPFSPSGPGVPTFDVLADGRFVIRIDEPEPLDARTPVVVLNWTAQFRARKK